MICKISHISTDTADSRKKKRLTGLHKSFGNYFLAKGKSHFFRQCIPVVTKVLKTIKKNFDRNAEKKFQGRSIIMCKNRDK